MLIVDQPVRGEMHDCVLAQFRTGCRCTIRREVNRFELLAFGSQARNLIGLLSAEAQSDEISQPRFCGRSFDIARRGLFFHRCRPGSAWAPDAWLISVKT